MKEKIKELEKSPLFGFYHPETNVNRGNLALLLKEQGKFDEACVVYCQTLKVFEETLGKDHQEALITQGNYSMLLFTQGKMD